MAAISKITATNQKIGYNLWFDTQAEEAAKFYTSLFNNSKMGRISRYPSTGQEIHGKAEGTVMVAEFEIENQHFTALNGGSDFKFNPSISFFINRETPTEIDVLWEKLIDGGEVLMALDKYPFSEHYGWLQDKFGVSWQLILARKDGDWRPPIIPSLLFVGDQCGRAEEAINFYTEIFKNSKIGNLARYEAQHKSNKEGTLMYGDFMLNGQWFAAMDSAQEHHFQFNEAISLIVSCDNQDEVDYYWNKLNKDGDPKAQQCGWLKDKFGVSWQIVPKILSEFMSGNDKKAQRTMKAMLQMKKLDIDTLTNA